MRKIAYRFSSVSTMLLKPSLLLLSSAVLVISVGQCELDGCTGCFYGCMSWCWMSRVSNHCLVFFVLHSSCCSLRCFSRGLNVDLNLKWNLNFNVVLLLLHLWLAHTDTLSGTNLGGAWFAFALYFNWQSSVRWSYMSKVWDNEVSICKSNPSSFWFL